jgi:hypothetical protein
MSNELLKWMNEQRDKSPCHFIIYRVVNVPGNWQVYVKRGGEIDHKESFNLFENRVWKML